LKADGSAWCWGEAGSGELGNGSNTALERPAQVSASGKTFIEVSAAGYTTCARSSDGSVWCWGLNDRGQLGINTSQTSRNVPTAAIPVGGLAEIAAGYYHFCARTTDGTLWCWGSNTSGELGDGTTVDRFAPVQVAAFGAKFTQVSSGLGHSCALKGDGTVWCWGDNSKGQLGDGTATSRSVPGQVVGLGSVVQIAAGLWHTCATSSDGAAWCWGLNEYGQLGDGTTTQRSVPVKVVGLPNTVAAISAHNSERTCARLADNTTWCWGEKLFADSTVATVVRPEQIVTLPTGPIPAVPGWCLVLVFAAALAMSFRGLGRRRIS
jgi:alpha-tubulin suppressor-like RCC1 family protein